MDNPLYHYSPIVRRPRLEWPHGARIALWVGLNIEHYQIDMASTSIHPGTAGLVPDPLNYGWRDYAPRVGVWRIMEILDRVGLKASVLLNADVCHHYPEIITEGSRRGWIWLAHGKNNSLVEADMTIEVERTYLQEVIATITTATGKAPKGWLGPALSETFHTPEILGDLGITYLCDWCADDQPFPLDTPRPMISVPYSIEVNDVPLFVGKSLSGEDFYQLLVDQFDVLYAEGAQSGRVMAIALHPFVTGQPFRSKYLQKALDYICAHDKVWLTTSDDIADWYFQHYYSPQPSI